MDWIGSEGRIKKNKRNGINMNVWLLNVNPRKQKQNRKKKKRKMNVRSSEWIKPYYCGAHMARRRQSILHLLLHPYGFIRLFNGGGSDEQNWSCWVVLVTFDVFERWRKGKRQTPWKVRRVSLVWVIRNLYNAIFRSACLCLNWGCVHYTVWL